MRKLTSIIIAAFAAASMTVSGYAQEFETEKPAIVFIGNVDTVNDSETDIVFDEASEDNRLFRKIANSLRTAENLSLRRIFSKWLEYRRLSA